MTVSTGEKIRGSISTEMIEDEKLGTMSFQNGTLPESLANKSPEEMAIMRKVVVRKIDLRLMPMLVTLFLLK